MLAKAHYEALDGLELRAHRPGAPLAQAPLCPDGGGVFPEPLEGCFQKVCPDCLQVALQDNPRINRSFGVRLSGSVWKEMGVFFRISS